MEWGGAKRRQCRADTRRAARRQDGYAQDEAGIHHRVLQGVVETRPGVDWCARLAAMHVVACRLVSSAGHVCGLACRAATDG